MTMDQFAKETLPISLEEEMRKSYLDYAMSVIVGRALPDVRDGLKPVHRRVLFAMHEMNNVYNRPYVKCARVVGDVMGKYHPHGDASIYDTLVRMAQDFSMRYTLVDDIDRYFSKAVYVAFAGTVITTFDGIVKQAINAITIIAVVFCCIDTTLCRNRVGTTWTVLETKCLYIIAQFGQ